MEILGSNGLGGASAVGCALKLEVPKSKNTSDRAQNGMH